MARISLAETPHDIWVVAEVNEGSVTPLTLETVYGARTMADLMGFYVNAAVLGSGLPDVAQPLIRAGADRVFVIDHSALATFEVELWSKALADVFVAQAPEFVLFGATPAGEALAPRLAQRFVGGFIARCVSLRIDDFDRAFVGKRAVFDGEYYEVVATTGPTPQFATVLPDCFGPPYMDAARSGQTQRLEVDLGDGRLQKSHAVEFEMPRPKLKAAKRIVSAGRQVGNVEAARQLAARLGAEFAGPREAVDEGYIDESQVVGVTGARVSPDLYIALGIRGDSHHAFGIQDARYVVAVYPDADAPIFRQADVAIVGDPATVAVELEQLLSRL